MTPGFNHIAYGALEVCNALDWAAVDAALRLTDLKPGDPALDIGCGNAFTAVRMARDFGLKVRAVERDPVMAELAARRIDEGGAGDRVALIVGHSAEILGRPPAPRLIVVIGAVDAAAEGVRDPVEVFARLKAALAPGGWLLWGEPFWTAEPSAPLRQIVEMTNAYQTDAGWRGAAEQAGFDVAHVHHSDEAAWRAYVDGMDLAVRDWVREHPDAPHGERLLARADQQKAFLDGEVRQVMGFGLYLLRAGPGVG